MLRALGPIRKLSKGNFLKSAGEISEFGFRLFGNGETPTVARGQILCQQLLPNRILNCDTKFCLCMSVEFPWTSERESRHGAGAEISPPSRIRFLRAGNPECVQPGLSPFGIGTSEMMPGFASVFYWAMRKFQKGE